MNKLSFNEVLKLFNAEYPTGKIFEKSNIKSKYNYEVCFQAGGKCYNYIVSSHVELINKLNLNVNLVYTKDYNNYLVKIEELKTNLNEMIEKGFYIDDLFGEAEKVEYTKKDINNLKNEINYLENKIKNAILI